MEDLCENCGSPMVGGFCELCSDPFVWPEDESAPDPLVGVVLEDRYEIEQLLSVGGMARLYRGIQRSLDRPVAIKVLPPKLMAGGDPEDAAELVSRFFVEAQTSSSLNHPNIVRILDFGRMKNTGLLYMVMELLMGTDLWNLMHETDEALSLTRIGSITTQILEGLGEAHSNGITHRDIKPENILVHSSRGIDLVKVIDFGVAKLGRGLALTKSGRVVGSPQYMSPEQARGEAVGPSADLYSVGIVLYEMLCGVVPFDGKLPLDVMQMHVTDEPPDPRELTDRELPESIVNICFKALAKDPDDRFPDARTFAESVATVLAPSRSSLPDGFLNASTVPASALLESAGPISSAPTSARAAPNAEPSLIGEGPLFSRSAYLARVRGLVGRDARPNATAFHGPVGSGRSRLCREAAAAAREEGAVVISAGPPPYPRSEVGFSGLAEIVAQMLETRSADEKLATGAVADSPLVAGGLRIIFARASIDPKFSTAFVRRAVSVAFDWACQQVQRRAGPSPVLCILDDVDRMDGGTLGIVADRIRSGKPSAFRWLLLGETCELELGPQALVRMPLTLLRRDAGQAMLDAQPTRTSSPPSARSSPNGSIAPGPTLPERHEVEPLLVELVNKWAPRNPRHAETIDGLVGRRVRGLGASLRHSLEAIAVLGSGPVAQLGRLLKQPEELDAALWPLAEQGMIQIHDGPLRATHEIIARATVAAAGARHVRALHTRAAALHQDENDAVELVAHHAIRGEVDFSTFFSVEEAIRLRQQRGDLKGTIALLQQGMAAARGLVERGDVETAASARAVFGAKLVNALHDAGRYEQAVVLIDELLTTAERDGADRVELLRRRAEIARRVT